MKRFFLALALALISLTVFAEPQNDSLPHVVIAGFANRTGDASFDTPSATATESLALTMSLLGAYEIVRPESAPAGATDKELLPWCERESVDYVLYGSIETDKGGAQAYSLSLFDRAKAKTTIWKTEKGTSIFDVFSCSDSLTFAVIDAIAGRHIGFGSIAFEVANPGAAEGEASVSLDGARVAEGLGPIDRVVEGRHVVSVVWGAKGAKPREIALVEIDVAEGEGTTVAVSIPKEKGKAAQERTPNGGAEPRAVDNSEMALVEGGTFAMGSDEGPIEERPAHEVTVDSFWMGKKEITVWNYMSVMGEDTINQRYQAKKNVSLPLLVDQWINAIKYCNERSKAEGLDPAYEIVGNKVTWIRKANGYRLPTEAEWEYAARGGKNKDPFAYPGSDSAEDVAWTSQTASGRGYRAPGLKIWNSLGLFDMGGNVYEWCWDSYARYATDRAEGLRNNPLRNTRVIRGGDNLHNNDKARCTARSYSQPDLNDKGNGNVNGSRNIGFRVVRSAIDETE